MPREIKDYKFIERHRDAWEEYKATKTYLGLYGKDQVKIMQMQNQFGQPYTDIYLKKDATPIRKMTAKFGSAMTFKDKKGKLFGDRILIKTG